MAHRIPFADLHARSRRRHPSFGAVGGGCGGPAPRAAVEAFEAEWAAYCGTRHAVAVASGADAVRLSLVAAGVGPGDEVVTVANGPAATAEAIAGTGATPVFVDVDESTGCMDPWALDAAVGPRTAAVVPVHLYGRVAAMDEVAALALRHGLLVVGDGGQAHGATSIGRRVGSLGDLGCSDFPLSANLGATTGGGAVTTDSGELAERLRRLRDRGTRPEHVPAAVGRRSHLAGAAAAELRAALPRLDAANAVRRALAARYAELLGDLDGVLLPAEDLPGDEQVFGLYVVRAEDRERLRAALDAAGVGTGLHDPVPAHRRAPFAVGGSPAAHLPVTDWWAEHLLALPLHPYLPVHAVDAVAGAVRSALRVAVAA